MSTEVAVFRSSLENLISYHTSNADLSAIDDIVLSYVVGIIKEHVSDDGVDASAMKEVMMEYIPSFEKIPEEDISTWVLDLMDKINDDSDKGKEMDEVRVDSLVTTICNEARKYSTSRSNSENSDKSIKHGDSLESPSEKPNEEPDIYSESLSTLMELFPTACNLEIQHCLAACNGEIERATSMILEREEQGLAIHGTAIDKLITPPRPIRIIDDKAVKDSIMSRYGFIDQADDTREHRPVAPKWEGKKMIRYRDNKVVSLKGERYTEIKKAEPEEMKKTYVNLKPGKQYRFH